MIKPNAEQNVSMFEVYRIILKSYRQTWFSLSMVCMSLLIACAGLSAVLIINHGAKASYSEQSTQRLLSATHQIVPAGSERSISLQDYAHVKRLGVSKATAVYEANAHLYSGGLRVSQRSVELIGIDFLSLLNQSYISIGPDDTDDTNTSNTSSSASELAASFGFAAPATYIHPKYLRELGLSTDDRLSLNEEASIELPPIQTIVIENMADALIFDIGVLLHLNGENGESKAAISRILILEGSTDAQIEKIENWLPAHLTLASLATSQSDESTSPQMTDSFYLNLFAMALLMFAVCLFIVLNAFNLLLFKRFAMLKVLRQLGVGRKQIVLAHALEFVLLAIFIAGLGIVFGSQLAIFASPSIRNIVEGLYNVQLGFAEISLANLYAKVLLITLAGIALALVSPFKQLNQSLSTTGHSDNAGRLSLILVSLALLFALAALLIFSFSSHLALLLVGAALVILSGCCVLLVIFPLILSTVLHFIPKKWTLIRLSMAQARSLSKKTKVACCAFFIAATSNLGMNLMVDSFRDSTESWLSQRLVAEYYLYSDDDAANAQLETLAAQTNVALYPRYERNIKFNQQDVQLFSYPLEYDFQQAMVFESQADEVWRGFARGESVFINQQLAIRNGLKVGDPLELVHPSSESLSTMTVDGIIYDYGNPKGQILMRASEFGHAQHPVSIFAVRGDEDAINAFKLAIQNTGIDREKQIFETRELLATSMQVFDRTFVITDSLNLVTLLVAALSLACTIVILLEQSKPQTMLLRSMGVSAWQSRRILLQQYIFLCLVAVMAATPFGILLSYVLIEQINYHAFNWSYPLIIDWLSVFQLYGISILVVGVVISLPIMHTTKHSLAQELKCLE